MVASQMTANGSTLGHRFVNARKANVAELAGDVTHQINNVMTSLMVCAEVLCRPSDNKAETTELAGEILSGLRRCRALSHGFLRVARRPWRPEPEPCDLQQLLAGIELVVQHRFKRAGMELELVVAPGLPAVRARPAELDLLLLELLQAGLQGGCLGQRLLLETQASRPPDTPASGGTDPSPPNALLEVTLSRDSQGGAHEPTPTREADLDLCRELVTSMGGELSLEPAGPGQSWHATLRLPLEPGR